MSQTIDAIYVDQFGWVYRTDGVIEPIEENGEMARVRWFRQYLSNGTINDFNGKYTIHIRYAHTTNNSSTPALERKHE